MAGFIFLGSKITADGDCSHGMKRCLLLGRKAMRNLDGILKSRDITWLTRVRIIKTTVFLTDLSDFSVVNGIYASYFQNDPPARSCVQVAGLPGGSKIEIELIAHR